MEFKEIIKELRKSKDYSADYVAEKIDIPAGSYKKYESGILNPGVPVVIKLADFYGVSTDYLLGRTEIKAMAGTSPAEQLDVTVTEQEMIERYTQLPEEWRLIFLDIIKKLAGVPDDAVLDTRPVIVFTRCHRMKASAGMGFDLENDDEWREVRIYDCQEAHDADFAVEVDGRSMEPDYLDGEIVFVKLADEVPVGSVGLFIHDGRGYIKERGEKCLISRNPEYPDIHGECKTVGVVIGKAETAP